MSIELDDEELSSAGVPELTKLGKAHRAHFVSSAG
jgi:hypothetical protein